jgi:hypothetical protein
MSTFLLDLGCGEKPNNLFGADVLYGIGTTSHPENNVVGVNLILEPIPYPDEFFDFAVASHFFEFIPRIISLPEQRKPFIQLMNELWRVLKFDGKLLSITHRFANPQDFQNSKHTNFITDKTFSEYFSQSNSHGFHGRFEIDYLSRDDNLVTLLTKQNI